MEETEELSIDVSNIFKSIQTACDELTQRGQEYLLVTADPVSHSCMKIGSEKGRQFLDVNSEVVINFFSYCFGAELLVDDACNITPTNVSQTDLNTQPLTSIQTDLHTQPITDIQTDIHEDVKSDIKAQDDESNVELNMEAMLQNQTDLSGRTNEEQSIDLSQNSQVQTSVDMNEDIITSPGFTTLEDTDSVTEMKVSLQTDNNVPKELDTRPDNSSEENQNVQHLSKDSEMASPLLSSQGQSVSPVLSSQDQSSTIQQSSTVSSESAEQQLIEMRIIDTSQEEGAGNCELQGKKNKSDTLSKDGHFLENDNDNVTLPIVCNNDAENSDIGQIAFTKTLNDNEKGIADNQLKQLNSSIEEALNKINPTPKTKTKSTTRKGKVDKEVKGNGLPSKISKQKTKTPDKANNQPEVNVSKKKEIVHLSKPTCSICKATFSRIHSLKGHMLIRHQLEISTEELQSGIGNTQEELQSGIENTQVTDEYKQSENVTSKTCSPGDKLTKKTPRRRQQQKVMSEICEDTGIVSEMNLIEIDPENEIRSGGDCEGKDSASVMDSVKKSKVADEKPKTKKRKIDNGCKILKTKKIKIEKDDTEASQKNSDAMLSLESTSNVDYFGKQEAKEGGDHFIVLEENHDENVPKRVKERKKSTDKAYCVICEKYFQRELNLTIHNIRFHPSKIMQQFGMAVAQTVPIKQEVDDYDEYEPYNLETVNIDTANESQQENIDTFGSDEDDEPNNLDTLLDPSDRLSEIKENDKIQQHINIAQKENKLLISCKYCEFSCEEFHQVMVHIARVHPNLSADLDIMMSCFYGINMYNKKCDECHMIFRSVASLWNHITEEHPVSVETCSKKKRLRHLIKKYKSKKSFVKCDLCKEQFRSIRALNLHMSIHPEAGKLYNCPQCAQSFSTKPNLTRHFKQIHLDERRFQCDICGKSIKSKEALKYHRTTHEVEKPKPFQCHICHKTLRKKETLQIHLRQHEGVKPYICEFCGMTFSQNGNRNKHVQLIHSAERNLECHKCGKTFKLQEHLKRHIKMHLIREGEIQPDKTFSCEYEGCGACYLTSAQLKVHTMSKHTFERPFMCGTCGKGFTTKDKMTRHAQTHMEGVFECNICQKKLPSKIGLSMHYKTHQLSVDNEFEPQDNYQTVIIPQEHGAPIKVELAHSEPITMDSLKTDEPNDDDRTYYIQTMKPDEGTDHTVQVEDNTILVDPSILESVLGATSDDQTVYYYVTDS